ncbi:MAG: uroporphyrinogen decarboxylase family protein [Promethearchaeota archaeon]|jgi:hypothetical protein
MTLSKRERVIRALERDDEPDKIPIQYLGFERTGSSYQEFLESDEYKENETFVENSFSKEDFRWPGNITELRFWNVDCHHMDPWRRRLKGSMAPGPPEHPGSFIATPTGRIWKMVDQVETGKPFMWYIDGVFHTPEIVRSYWDEYGKPSDFINDEVNYSPKIWDEYVESLSPYLYPMARSVIALNDAMHEGMTPSRVVYFMRKQPKFLHEVLTEYANTNIEMIKRYAEAGVDIWFYLDDLGMKGRSILSLENFRKLGLDCIQTLEPAAGVDLAHLKETLGDRLSFMGGMDVTRALSFGTPQEVEEEVKRCIRAAGYGGGYFAGPSHNVLNAPWENILAFRAAIEKYREYPLNV